MQVLWWWTLKLIHESYVWLSKNLTVNWFVLKHAPYHDSSSDQASHVFHLLGQPFLLGVFCFKAREEEHDVTDHWHQGQDVEGDGDNLRAGPGTHDVRWWKETLKRRLEKTKIPGSSPVKPSDPPVASTFPQKGYREEDVLQLKLRGQGKRITICLNISQRLSGWRV